MQSSSISNNVDWSRVLLISNSKSVDQLFYDPQNQKLRVHYISTNTLWEYLDVTPEEYTQLMSAKSIGSYLNKNIRNNKTALKIDQTISKVVQPKRKSLTENGQEC